MYITLIDLEESDHPSPDLQEHTYLTFYYFGWYSIKISF